MTGLPFCHSHPAPPSNTAPKRAQLPGFLRYSAGEIWQDRWMPDQPPLHPAIRHLEFLLGHWVGKGEGEYPTIDDFSYREQVWFDHVGKPFLSYRQATRDASSDLPLHAEAGYLRPVGQEGLELVVSQPSGIVEIHEGSVSGQSIVLRSVQVLTTTTAKDVTEVTRTIAVDDGRLEYELAMAAVGHPLRHHLSAVLRRQD